MGAKIIIALMGTFLSYCNLFYLFVYFIRKCWNIKNFDNLKQIYFSTFPNHEKIQFKKNCPKSSEFFSAFNFFLNGPFILGIFSGHNSMGHLSSSGFVQQWSNIYLTMKLLLKRKSKNYSPKKNNITNRNTIFDTVKIIFKTYLIK